MELVATIIKATEKGISAKHDIMPSEKASTGLLVDLARADRNLETERGSHSSVAPPKR